MEIGRVRRNALTQEIKMSGIKRFSKSFNQARDRRHKNNLSSLLMI